MEPANVIDSAIQVSDHLRDLVGQGAIPVAVISLMANFLLGYLLWSCSRDRLVDKDNFAQHLRQQVERIEQRNQLLQEFAKMGRMFDEPYNRDRDRPPSRSAPRRRPVSDDESDS